MTTDSETQDGIHASMLQDGILKVELHRPATLNALKLRDFNEISRIFREIERNPDVRVVILTGAGRGFCSGINLDDEADAQASSPNEILEQQYSTATFPLEMRRCRKPIIAAVNGAAVGGGLCLALSADIRIASTKAVFISPFIKIGATSDLGISYLLPRIVGHGVAMEMSLTARSVRADEALRIGLVTRVVEPEELMASALETARTIVGYAPLSVRLTKQVLNHNIDASSLEAAMEIEHRNQAIAVSSADASEALAAFRERRAPRFKDK